MLLLQSYLRVRPKACIYIYHRQTDRCADYTFSGHLVSQKLKNGVGYTLHQTEAAMQFTKRFRCRQRQTRSTRDNLGAVAGSSAQSLRVFCRERVMTFSVWGIIPTERRTPHTSYLQKQINIMRWYKLGQDGTK